MAHREGLMNDLLCQSARETTYARIWKRFPVTPELSHAVQYVHTPLITWVSPFSNKRHKVCMKPHKPPMTNAGTKTAFRHGHLQAFPKRKHLLRSEVSWCEQIGADLQLHRSTCFALQISTQKEPFPRSEFTPALHLDIQLGTVKLTDWPRLMQVWLTLITRQSTWRRLCKFYSLKFDQWRHPVNFTVQNCTGCWLIAKCRFSTKFSRLFDHHGKTKKETVKNDFERWKKPECPRRSARKIDQYVIDCACEDACVKSCKREVGKEMFARTTPPIASAHKNTLCVPIYCAGQVTANHRLWSTLGYGLTGK